MIVVKDAGAEILAYDVIGRLVAHYDAAKHDFVDDSVPHVGVYVIRYGDVAKCVTIP